MKKKLLSILLCASMVSSLAVGCGSNASSSDEEKTSDNGETTTLTMWMPPLDSGTQKQTSQNC